MDFSRVVEALLLIEFLQRGNEEYTLSEDIYLLRAPLVARNPNLQVVITHTSDVYNQHLFGLPLRKNGMHRTQFKHAFWTYYHACFVFRLRETYAKHSDGAKAF